jgi:hypothetical protein
MPLKSELEKEEVEAMLALVGSAFPEEKREHRAGAYTRPVFSST